MHAPDPYIYSAESLVFATDFRRGVRLQFQTIASELYKHITHSKEIPRTLHHSTTIGRTSPSLSTPSPLMPILSVGS
jgi:hypothetical protein